MALTPQTNTDLNEIASLLEQHDRFVLCGHVSPDGDCLGSQLALWHTLRSIGKTAYCILVRDEPVAPSTEFMPGIDEMVPACEFDKPADVFIGLDVPSRSRIEEDACAILDRCALSVTIDHHASDTVMCDFVYVDPDAASASILVWELSKMLCSTPPMETALCVYTGLVTDTGGFRYQNSDVRAFDIASELVEFGVDPSYVATCSFQNRSIASLRLEELVISRLRFVSEGRAALSWVKVSDLEKLEASKSDTEPLIETLRSIHGVRVACMLREQDGMIRGSLRSKDSTDVSKLAREFGGGGHKAAAGFTLDMELTCAIELLENKLRTLVG